MLSLKNITGLPEITKPDQDQSLHNYEETLSESNKIDVEETQEQARDEWVIFIREKLEQAKRDDETTISRKLCIYRVPHHLREDNIKSYVPETVSLGPYHHGKRSLRSMEPHKWRAVKTVLQRTNQNIEMYIDAMRDLEEKARACYQGQIAMTSNEFTQMLVLDGCFVLEVLKGAYQGFKKIGYAPNDPVFAIPGVLFPIRQDMVMLENQLPLFVLNRLVELQLDTRGLTLADLVVWFFRPLLPTVNNKSFGLLSDEGELHCLDVFRRSLLQSSLTPPRFRKRKFFKTPVPDKRQYEVKCVTELRYAGIKFIRKKTDLFRDIEFRNGYLEIPRLVIHEGTKSLFLNLITFEQCHTDSRSSNHVTSYMMFMENLITSHGDVTYLRDCGIIEHYLENDSDVVDLFKQMCKGIVFDLRKNYLYGVACEVSHYHKRNAYKANFRYKYLDTLKERYFNNPWAYLPFIAAVLLLVLTFTQTFFTVYPYYFPRS